MLERGPTTMFRFLPWKSIVKRAARAYGIADPALWLARIRSFAQPSEVAEPIELLRAGVLFHARGIVNTKAIQHNLDWIWPYWVQRQFDPNDVSFIPRAFSFSHVNLTHRNWTAVGLPELSIYPIVDPRGLFTPLQDGWSIDCWIVGDDGRLLAPSRLPDAAVRQELAIDQSNGSGDLAVLTLSRQHGATLKQTARVVIEHDQPVAELQIVATAESAAKLVVALRPYNPEGVQFIDTIDASEPQTGWLVNDKTEVMLSRAAAQMLVSDYAHGDVSSLLHGSTERIGGNHDQPHVACSVGMATAAAVYPIAGETTLTVRVPLQKELAALGNLERFDPRVTWSEARKPVAKLQVPDRKLQFLYDAAVQTMLLLSADEVVPGPYTYRRFWFRDACIMMNSLLAVGMVDRCRRMIEQFPARQLRNGYFRSQEGEWDSNGQVLWFFDRFEQLTGERLSDELLATIPRAVDWIHNKRVMDDADPLHVGLLPAGFSAEHLGPNDHYYWDDFWAEAGLRSAAAIYARRGDQRDADAATAKADDLRRAIDRSIHRIPAWRSLSGIPASPHRRIDAGAVGSLVADYPLQLFAPGAPPIMATVDALLRRCFLHGGFFQDMIHSGVNAYLTLDIAQTLLRAGDPRYRDLVEAVARLASPTGQWPEAIHPQTGGGCMGDGQHGWAAAEWAMMIRSLFVREEADRLVIGSGLFAEWFESDDVLQFGPTLTPWGAVTVTITNPRVEPMLRIEAEWRGALPRLEVSIPGFERIVAADANVDLPLVRDDTMPIAAADDHHARPARHDHARHDHTLAEGSQR
ncbi:hypothetical protein PLANPX_0763 [Lacipirellula parvula]|uniref:Uncharacterized protein n=2 Tax=Lacipirellula parvula TaxID=2650471 RepID=A0A5K7X8R4_9BACT|nr:hypothetical protein PLANPX_0763 [Lacipirellula parvula]